MAAQVTYSVGITEMNMLMDVDLAGSQRYQTGTARFLEAVCKEVWPSIRLRVTPDKDEPQWADVVALRQYTVWYLRPEPSETSSKQSQRFFVGLVGDPIPSEFRAMSFDRVEWAETVEEAKAKVRTVADLSGVVAVFLEPIK